jgi:CubicO group peptidase (beta-lactamase class C family)
LKIKNTFFWHEVSNIKNIVSKNRQIDANILKRNWGFIGACGIYSNVSDLYKLINGLLSFKILNKNSLNSMFSIYTKTKSGLGIGHGCFIYENNDWNLKEIWTRGNEDWGHNAVIRYFPQQNSIVIVCTNSGELTDKQNTGNKIISNEIINFLLK